MDFETGFTGDPVYRITCARDAAKFISFLSFVSEDRFADLHERRLDFLHPNERNTYDSLKFERRRKSYLLGRFAAKKALCPCLHSESPAAVCVRSGVFGQPVVHADRSPPVGVSLAHCAGAAAAIAFPEEHPMAVDLERIDPDRIEAMLTQIQSTERALHERLTAQEPDPVWVTCLWTAKEALSKILKCGMTTPFALLELACLSHEENRFAGEFKNFGQYKFLAWQLPAHMLALVIPRRSQIQIEKLK